MKQKKASAVMRESIAFGLLFLLLAILAFGKDRKTPFQLNEAIKTALIRSGPVHFEDIQTVPEWWMWTQNHLLDILYPEVLYNGQKVEANEAYVVNSKVIGRVSLRQLRVRKEICDLPAQYRLPGVCRYDYDWERHDTFPHMAGNNTWWHGDSPVTGALGTRGRHAYYDGGGYQVTLPSERRKVASLLHTLYQSGWIGKNSRAVVVEFTLFHAPTNLFSSVRLILELPAAGGAHPYSQVASVYLYKYMSAMDNIVLACEMLYTVATMLMIHHQGALILRLGKDYLKNPWNSLEVALCTLSLAYMGCFVYRFVLVRETVDRLHATYHEEYVDISFLAFWDQMLQSFQGFLVFLVILKFLRLLRNQRTFAKFGGVYKKASMELLTFTAVFVIWVCAYTSLGVALYGAWVYNFSQYDIGLQTITGLLTGIYRSQDPQSGIHHFREPTLHSSIGYKLFIISFLLVAVGSLTAYMVSILSWNIHSYRQDWLPSLKTVETLHYFWDKFLVGTGIRRQWPHSEDDESCLPAEFTMAEIEYQVDEMLFKMNALAGTSGLPEKPPMYFTDSDCTYGNGDDGISSGGSEQRGFHEDRFESRIHKIEDQLLANEPHLAQLLHLDSIGAEVLTEEREKQLRSQLELEIFRRLQMARHGNRLPSDRTSVGSHVKHAPVSHTNSSASRNSTGSSTIGHSAAGHSRKSNSSTCSANMSHDSGNSSPAVLGVGKRKMTFPKPPSLGVLQPAEESIAEDSLSCADQAVGSIVSPRDVVPVTASSPVKGRIAMSDGLVLQDLSEPSCSSLEEGIPLKDLEKSSSAKSAPSHLAETRILDDLASASSCSSGGAEVHAVMSNAPKGGARSKIFTPPEGSKTDDGKSARTKGKGGTTDKIAFDCLYDSSSGSDLEVSKPSTKARGLRKTKSRGKGKGQAGLSPIEGLDEFEFDSPAYNADRERRRGRDPLGLAKGKHRQCWM